MVQTIHSERITREEDCSVLVIHSKQAKRNLLHAKKMSNKSNDDVWASDDENDKSHNQQNTNKQNAVNNNDDDDDFFGSDSKQQHHHNHDAVMRQRHLEVMHSRMLQSAFIEGVEQVKEQNIQKGFESALKQTLTHATVKVAHTSDDKSNTTRANNATIHRGKLKGSLQAISKVLPFIYQLQQDVQFSLQDAQQMLQDCLKFLSTKDEATNDLVM